VVEAPVCALDGTGSQLVAACQSADCATTPSLAKEGVSGARARATSTACLQELFELVARSRSSSAFQAMSRDVARARESPPVPKCTRLVPVMNQNLAITGNTTCPFAGLSSKPSDGLEPSTPPYHGASAARVATHGNGFRLSEPFSRPSDLRPLPLVATALLHKCSMIRCLL
jgi:hypothetical protein